MELSVNLCSLSDSVHQLAGINNKLLLLLLLTFCATIKIFVITEHLNFSQALNRLRVAVKMCGRNDAEILLVSVCKECRNQHY